MAAAKPWDMYIYVYVYIYIYTYIYIVMRAWQRVRAYVYVCSSQAVRACVHDVERRACAYSAGCSNK